ncbi:helix-turn-helix domain-containing protein [Amycolatopsis sp. H20-H5]|uniref:helix-turn-helix domain-containing protein n=1 Tax=Amycolatopsis sp. H20-H5 TaxID=3046309 RepID=UPI002DBFF4FF|nr:XRE family transcriptional regulator [Amycolatopsis sp. H20-H5]MEC3980728.1 XRE family transcriptional regulator [Amycolatopsis sp. H20-H5]
MTISTGGPDAPATNPGRSADEQLGRHIRDARTARNLTLPQLAERTGLSRSYLSNVERNVNSPTISTLRTILDALGVSLAQLFRTVEGERRAVIRPADRVEIARTGNDAVRYELLTPNPAGRLEMMIMKVAPGASSGELPHTHAGEEVGFMLSGRLRYWIDDECHELQAGDAITYESTRPHRYENPGGETAVSVWALTPPSF